MRTILTRMALAMTLAAATPAFAQEGFPLDGTWRGERQAGTDAPVTIVMILEWDGKKMSGIINPGPKSAQIEEATLEPQGWRVTVNAKSGTGESIHFEGSISNLGAYDRAIVGTWTEGGRDYRIRMVRE